MKYERSGQAVTDMAVWMLNQGLSVTSSQDPNTGVYVKVKPDKSKLQVIADASLRNDSIHWTPLNFILLSLEHVKPLLRLPGNTYFFAFDISNFYHGFILPDLFHELFPIVMIISRPGNTPIIFRCLRCTFGDKFSPVLTHQCLCHILGIPSTVYRKGVDPKPHISPHLDPSSDVSGAYIDDNLDASKDFEECERRYLDKRRRIREFGFSVKPSSVEEGVLDLEIAGRRYSGFDSHPFIANTKKNTIRSIALVIRMILAPSLHISFIRSMIGSLTYASSHHKKALPFLASINRFAEAEQEFICLPHNVKRDTILALQLCLLPWSLDSEIRWSGVSGPHNLIIVDASREDGFVGMITADSESATVATIPIPCKFLDSQQSAELFGLYLALKKGEVLFGPEFGVLADSASAISSVSNIKMSSSPRTRNDLMKKFVRWSFCRNLRVSIAWVETDLNLADTPIRTPVRPIGHFMPFDIKKVEESFRLHHPKFLDAHNFFQK
jgi:hypothetical protein